MAVELKSYNEILGQLVRKIIADSPVNDLAPGSVLLTLLEAVAANDFDNSTAILSVLETLNIDAIRNSDLDTRASDYGLTRKTSRVATGFVTISDSSITKRATTLYAVKPPPIAGSSVLYVNDASSWEATGTLYIGRGTQQFEGPVNYTSVVNNGSFYTITLASALQKDHLSSDSVVDAQNTVDRLIAAGTVVTIPPNNQNPEIRYSVLRDSVLPAGEDSVTGIAIVASEAGVRSNTGIGTIVAFSAEPFVGAVVTNTSALTDGADTESDDELRERIKSYAATLARGTREAILAAILNVSDSTDGKQVASAVITEPATIGDPSIVYIDDGSGFQPSFQGQPIDTLLASATGNEEFLQLANFPLPRPQVVNVAEGPYQLVDGMALTVKVGIEEESVFFSSSQFANIAAATLPEVVVAINDQAVNFRARLTNNSSQLLLSPVAHDVETIQVLAIRSGEAEVLYANSVFRFPTNEYSYIKLYHNGELLRATLRSATVTTAPFATWSITGPGTLIVQIDGTPAQTGSFTTLDFNGNPFSSLEISDWVSAFNAKFAGVVAAETGSSRITLSSNREGATSSIAVVGGTYIDQVFGPNDLKSDIGQDADFILNRQTGNLQLKFKPAVGDVIEAGSVDSKGNFISSASLSGIVNLSTDPQGRRSILVISVDGDVAVRQGVSFPQGAAVTVQDMGGNVMRLVGSTSSSFASSQIGDYIWITERSSGWLPSADCGLHKILRKGDHLTAGIDTWVEVYNQGVIAGGPYTVQDSNDLVVFKSENYPQVFDATASLPVPSSATLQSVADTLVTKLKNVLASVYKTNTVKTTSFTEESGSIALPVSTGRGSSIFTRTLEEQVGNPSHTASKISSRDLLGSFRRTAFESAFLERVRSKDSTGILDAAATPGIEGVDPYSELLSINPSSVNTSNIELDDVAVFSKANNASLLRSIKELQAGNDIGTQFSKPTTVMDHIAGDEIVFNRPMSISSDDSAVFVIDRDLVGKTINVNFWRTGKVNTQYVASTTAFSADDSDNEPGINFGTPAVWSKTLTGAEFKDYGVLFRARNWYRTGGVANTLGATMILRSKEYGRSGERLRFRLEYPTIQNQSTVVAHSNLPDWSLTTCTLGSGSARTTSITSGTTFKVTNPSANIYHYTFQQPSVDLTTVQPGDIMSIQPASGVSTANAGQFSILALDNPGKWVEVYNPNGSVTSVGLPEISQATAVADVVGTPQVTDITCTAQGATISTIGSSEYFTLYDDVGMVVFWYDIDNAGSAAPTVVGASRYVEIATVITGDSASVVASKTAVVVGSDLKFSATALGNVVTVTNSFNGPVTLGSAGPNTGFSITLNSAGTPDVSIGGLYFLLADQNGSVAVWFNVNSEPEPPHGADRSIQVLITAGDSASTVATKVAAAINGDVEFSSSALGSVITITDALNGSRTDIAAETSGFAVATTQQGVDDGVETITISNLFQIFPLAENDCQTVCDVISTSQLLTAVPVGDSSALFLKATREDTYSYTGNASALAFDHDPDPFSGKNSFVTFWDGFSFVKSFENSNPQFVLKRDLVLPGVAPSIYAMASCPNPDTIDVGEFFKLVPKTIDNIKHHMSHKALSQLPLVADVSVADNYRRIQVKSKKLGTDGAVEMVGGRANAASFALLGDGQVTSQNFTEYIEARVSAFPSSLQIGDYVTIRNSLPAKRRSRLLASDLVDVVNPTADSFEYRIKAKSTGTGPFVNWTITDVSGSYALPSGAVWRWTHAAAGATIGFAASINGTIAAPADYQADGTPNAANLHEHSFIVGSITSAGSFKFTLSALPSSGDYMVFENSSGTKFAVWFDLTGSDPMPTGATFLAVPVGNRVSVNLTGITTADDAVATAFTALSANSNVTASFSLSQTTGMSLSSVRTGDLLCARSVTSAPNSFTQVWDGGNIARSPGDELVSGFPVINLNVSARYIDVLNPWGKAMSSDYTGTDGSVDIYPAVAIKWQLGHRSRLTINSVTRASGIVTVVTDQDHGLNPSDTFLIEGASIVVDGSYSVGDTISPRSFNFVDAGVDSTSPTGVVTRGTLNDVTRYRLEKIAANGLIKLRSVSGPSPRFADLGVAVDDYITLSGSTFASSNNGTFRVLGVSNDHVVFRNESAVEQVSSIDPFNEEMVEASWTGASTLVTGAAGCFRRVQVGDWVKKSEDSEEFFVQVASISPAPGPTATSLTLSQAYPGLTGSSVGVRFDQNSGADAGIALRSVDDIVVLEGDSAYTGDSLVVENIISSGWFSTSNSGMFELTAVGTSSNHETILRIVNPSGIVESNRQMSVNVDGLYILESASRLYESDRYLHHAAIATSSSDQRTLYMLPADRSYKISDLYQTSISSSGKMGIEVGVTTGVDGYTYYTGLMRTVQRIIDGFEPDATNYPGRRAVGGAIEPLPPLIRSLNLSINVTTRDGVNLTDLTNDIKSSIIGYVNSLGVGEDVILSAIIARVMDIPGIAAVTFTNPVPSTERVAVADDAKAFVTPESISIS